MRFLADENIKREAQLKFNKEKGFGLLEVMISMLIATTFLLGLAQAMMLSAMINIRSQEKSQAVARVENDIENIKFLASSYTSGICGTYGQNFRDSIIGTFPTTGTTYTFSFGTYNITRTYTPLANQLGIEYQVSYPTNISSNGRKLNTDSTLFRNYTEVIPNGVFVANCP